jgi:hypothetical protein
MRYDAGTFSGFLGEGEVSARPAGSRRLKSDRLQPLTWKPDYPNPALLKMTLQDAYWGAKRVI